jgi:hypothetical protein
MAGIKSLKKDVRALEKSRKKGVTGTYKQFNSDLYDLHDTPAVRAVLDYLDSLDIYAVRNSDKYGPDIIVYEGLRPSYYIEVEQRAKWTTGPFPRNWTPVHIPARKVHLLSLGMRCEIWVLSMCLKFALIIPDKVSSDCAGDLREFSNSQIAKGEQFIHIPIELCIHKELEHGQY